MRKTLFVFTLLCLIYTTSCSSTKMCSSLETEYEKKDFQKEQKVKKKKEKPLWSESDRIKMREERVNSEQEYLKQSLFPGYM